MTKLRRPLKAIRTHCLACGGRPKEVKGCQSADCALFPYRMGTNPARKGIGVGIRHKNGQFQAIIASPAGVSQANIGSKGVGTALSSSDNLGQPSKKQAWSGVSVSKKGQVEIKETEEGLLIKITNDQS